MRPQTPSLNSLKKLSRRPSQYWFTRLGAKVERRVPLHAISCASTSGHCLRVSNSWTAGGPIWRLGQLSFTSCRSTRLAFKTYTICIFPASGTNYLIRIQRMLAKNCFLETLLSIRKWVQFLLPKKGNLSRNREQSNGWMKKLTKQKKRPRKGKECSKPTIVN